MIFQKELVLSPKKRGFHIITQEVLGVIPKKTGLIHIFIKHTSASLTINENADPSVRFDFENHFNLLVSEKEKHYTHTLEGPDDMTSHIKSSLLGSSVSFPVKGGLPCLGTWQGVYLCEHRNNAKPRKIVVTFMGI
jgi:secondary thiamine-phosphate synthase enzyme